MKSRAPTAAPPASRTVGRGSPLGARTAGSQSRLGVMGIATLMLTVSIVLAAFSGSASAATVYYGWQCLSSQATAGVSSTYSELDLGNNCSGPAGESTDLGFNDSNNVYWHTPTGYGPNWSVSVTPMGVVGFGGAQPYYARCHHLSGGYGVGFVLCKR